MANKLSALKAKLTSNIGKIRHASKEKAREAKEKTARNYDKGVNKIQDTTLIDKVADMSDGLTKKNEKELLENKDSTFRKIRKVFVNGSVIITPFIIGIPIKMIDDAIQRNVDLKNAEEYNRVYDREILWTEKEIAKRRKEGKDVKDLLKYQTSLKESKAKTNKYIEDLKKQQAENEEKEEAAKESALVTGNFYGLTPLQRFMYMQPSDFDNNMEAFDQACMESFKGALYDAAIHVKYEKYVPATEQVKETPVIEEPVVDTDARKTAFIATESLLMDRVLSDKALQKSIFSSCSSGGKSCFNNGSYNKVSMLTFHYKDHFGKHVTESMVKPVNRRLSVLVESINKKIRKTGCSVVMEGSTLEPQIILQEESITKHVENGVRKGVHAVRNAIPNESPVKKAERASEPLDNAVNSVIDTVRKTMKGDTQRKIVDGKYRFKLTRIIGKCIAYGALGVLVHPAVAAIAFLGKMAFDKHIDHGERKKIVADLEDEKEICEEKIKDAENKGDNENKYKLMRIRKSLDREIVRIRMHEDK